MTSVSASASSGSSRSPSLSQLVSVPSLTPSTSSISSSADGEVAVDPAGAAFANALHAVEQLHEDLNQAFGHLLLAASRARKAHNLSPTVGQPIMALFAQASTSATASLGFVAKGHRLSTQLARRLDIPHAYGDTGKDDDDKVFTGA